MAEGAGGILPGRAQRGQQTADGAQEGGQDHGHQHHRHVAAKDVEPRARHRLCQAVYGGIPKAPKPDGDECADQPAGEPDARSLGKEQQHDVA